MNNIDIQKKQSAALMQSKSDRPKTLFVISTTAGWSTVGHRIKQETERDSGNQVFAYNSSSFFKRLSHHKDYHKVPFHVPLFDPFTVNSWQAHQLRRRALRYDAVVAGHITQAAAMIGGPRSTPVFAYIDATRHLHKVDFSDKRISDGAIERERRVFQQVRHIFAMSTWAANDIEFFYGIPRQKITIVPPPAPRADAVGISNFHPHSGRLQLLFIGSDFERKGGDQLIRWQREYLYRFFELNIVTKQRYTDFSVPCTNWLGEVGNERLLNEVLPSMDLLCFPTTKDCSPLVIAEAAMAGVPAIATRIGGLDELIEHQVTGALLTPGDEMAFVNLLLSLANNRGELKRLGLNAREKAIHEFAPEYIYKRMVAQVQNVLQCSDASNA